MQDVEAPRYEDDLYSWSLDQADRLRQLQKRTGNDSQGIDFENIIEEVEDLAVQARRILTGHIRQVMTHMGAITYTSLDRAASNVKHWLKEIRTFRSNIIDELDENPGLKGVLEHICEEQWSKSRMPTLDKIEEMEDLSPSAVHQLRKRISETSPPSASEVLGFDWQRHEQNSKKDIQDYFDEDPDAPRYPAFVRDALNRIEELDRSAGRRRD